MIQCKHENIVKFIQALRDKNGHLYIIMEFCDGGDLKKLRLNNIDQNGLLEESFTIEILRQIGNGLKYLHEMNLGHRDIDPQNILVNDGKIKILDFGYSFKAKTRSKPASTRVGKELYAAPEVLKC